MYTMVNAPQFLEMVNNTEISWLVLSEYENVKNKRKRIVPIALFWRVLFSKHTVQLSPFIFKIHILHVIKKGLILTKIIKVVCSKWREWMHVRVIYFRTVFIGSEYNSRFGQ